MTGHQSTELTSPVRGVISLIRRGSLAWYGEELGSQSSCRYSRSAGSWVLHWATIPQLHRSDGDVRSLSFIIFIYLFIYLRVKYLTSPD